jgi:hypothetical protein
MLDENGQTLAENLRGWADFLDEGGANAVDKGGGKS